MHVPQNSYPHFWIIGFVHGNYSLAVYIVYGGKISKVIWTKEKILFLQKYYSTHGANWCGKKLDFSPKQTQHKARELQLKLTKAGRTYVAVNRIHLPKPNHLLKVNPEKFMTPQIKEVVYLLGFIWGDGYLNHHHYGIWSEFLEEDFTQLKDIFLKTGDWNVNFRTRTGCRPVVMVHTHSKVFYEFLQSMDYKIKTGCSPHKILHLIPENLHPYWFRGFSDADGCFYFNSKQYIRQFSIGGTYNQDWQFMIDLSKKLGILKFDIGQSKTKNGNSSHFRYTSKSTVVTFGDYIYKNYDGMGLKRKYDKFMLINTPFDGRTTRWKTHDAL